MNEDTFLYRQAHPNFTRGEDITSQVFFPFPKDDGQLSVDDGDQTTPGESFDHFNVVEGCESEGVWAVKVRETEESELTATPDPKEDWPPHALIDFRGHDLKKHRKLAKKLKAFAMEHGCLYRPG